MLVNHNNKFLPDFASSRYSQVGFVRQQGEDYGARLTTILGNGSGVGVVVWKKTVPLWGRWERLPDDCLR
jgi:hypothetical protein